MKRIVLALLLVLFVGASLPQSEAQAYYRRPLLRRGIAAAARVGIGYGLSRGYYGGYRGFYPGYYGGYGYGYRPGFGIGFY